MIKLSTIPDHTLSITCGVCKHHSMLEVANLMLVVGEEATAHDVRHATRPVAGVSLKSDVILEAITQCFLSQNIML